MDRDQEELREETRRQQEIANGQREHDREHRKAIGKMREGVKETWEKLERQERQEREPEERPDG